MGRALRTEFRRFDANGTGHFANATEPSVPEALADVVAGFTGLDDFLPESQAHRVAVPEYNLAGAHYLVPEDLATIYSIAPLQKAGLDGAAQGIVIVGQSSIDPDDLRTFKTRHNLPANDPKFIPYSGSEPGFNSAELEGLLDLEWAGAIAPKATVYYVYGTSAFSAMIFAINLNLAPVISVSYGGCEYNYSPTAYRAIAQQANAQGITILAASGDAGAANCDPQGVAAFASKGLVPLFPAILPEVTAMGGTQFDEANGNYWAASNSPNLGSALSYIPEVAWNESGSGGLLSSGGGISRFYPKPSWQIASGLTDAPFRHYPDISLTAAGHDGYIVSYVGGLTVVSGTSASTPVMAGVVALLNQYQVANGFQSRPGLGNINPQLYRLAQSAPSSFHDVTAGDNIVPCTLGSPDCLNGKYGYPAGPGYDLATGLGSIDANNLFANWNSKTKPVSVNLVLSTTRLNLNDSLNVTALLTSPSGGTPTGTVEFVTSNNVVLGSAPLVARGSAQAADLTIPAYRFGSTGNFAIIANYGGDAAFSGAGAQKTVQVSTPAGAAGIVISAPASVWPNVGRDAIGLSWQTTLTIRESAGVPARLTGFTIDGQAQDPAAFFPATTITAGGSLAGTVLLRDLAAPASKTFGFTGIDAAGNTWSRTASVSYMPIPSVTGFEISGAPLVVNQNPADPACPWPVQVNLEDWGGSLGLVNGFYVGTTSYTSQIVPVFGTERLEAWSSLQGTVCVSGVKPPAAEPIWVSLSTGQNAQVFVSFAGPPANPVTLSSTPKTVTLEARDAGRFAQATLALGVSSPDAEWTVTVLPGNRTAGWLTVSPLSGKGPGQLTLTARGTGFGNGAYRALLQIQSNRAVPQILTVPVMLTMGPNGSGMAVRGVGNAASFRQAAAPGGILSVFGSQLANDTKAAAGNPIAYTNSGVTATVNGIPAPVVYASPNQLNVQVPYAAGAGTAVLGVNNNGEIAGYLFQIAPSAPGVFVDSDGNLAPKATGKAGAVATVYLTGVGEVSPALKTAYAPSTASTASYKPVLPVSVTVGGVPAFVQSATLVRNQVGTAQVSFLIPADMPAGPQPVIVTVGNTPSPAVNLIVQ